MLSLLTSLATVAAVATGRPDVRPVAPLTKQQDARLQIAEFSKAADMFFTDCNRYPTTEEGLAALSHEPVDNCEGNWGPKPYISKSAIDPWGWPLIYSSKKRTHYAITSLGADGREGGTDDNQDLTF